jgi:hypothetical protein
MAIHRSLWKSRNKSRRAPIATKQIIASALALLKSCSKEKNLCRGIAVHGHIQEQGLLQTLNPHYVGSAIVSMYAKCGALPKAQQALQDLPCRDVVTWDMHSMAIAAMRFVASNACKEMTRSPPMPSLSLASSRHVPMQELFVWENESMARS